MEQHSLIYKWGLVDVVVGSGRFSLSVNMCVITLFRVDVEGISQSEGLVPSILCASNGPGPQHSVKHCMKSL